MDAGVSGAVRAVLLEPSARAKQAQAVAEHLNNGHASLLEAPNFRVGRLSRSVMNGLEE